MLINKGKASDTKLKQKNNIAIKEVPSKLKKNLNENLKKPLIKCKIDINYIVLETNSFNRPNFSPLDKNFVNKLKPVVKSTPLTSVNNIRHAEVDQNIDKTSKLESSLKNSEFFSKRTSCKEEKATTKKANNKKENSSQNTFFTNNNTLLAANQEKTVLSKQIITQGNVVSPIKMLRQISSLTNNNLTTNITELAKDGLTIKTNTIESGELANTMQSPSNYKTVGNNLKTISSKITPKATHNTFLASNLLSKKNSNNNVKGINLFEKTIKIVEYNDEKNNIDLDNINILQTIQHFGQILRNTNLGQNCIYSEENLRKINDLNEVLKSLGNENKESIPSNPSKQEDKTVSIGSGGRAVTSVNNNLGGSLRASKNNQKAYFSHTNNNGVKKNLKNLHNTVKQTLSPKLNTNERLISKENEDCNITEFSEQKINSATKKDIIISEIYKNSDYRIKRYGVLFEFITTNISEIKNLIVTSTLRKSEVGDDDKDELMKINLLSNNQETHMKKKSSTSNEIEKIAKKINEENNLMFSSISILNSTLKKQPYLDKVGSNSKEKRKVNYSENYNDSDIEEFDYNEDKKDNVQRNPHENSIYDRVNHKENKRKDNNNINLLNLINSSKSFIISSINSDFYKDLFYESFLELNNNNVSNEMSELCGDPVVFNHSFDHSEIVKMKDFEESLDKTRENINLFDRRNIAPLGVINNLEKKFTIPVMKPKLASSHNIPKEEVDKGKVRESDYRTVVNNNLEIDPVNNQDTKKDNEKKCIIF